MKNHTNAITEIREKTGLSRAAFCRKYEIPIRTCENWEFGIRIPPAYVVNLLSRAVDADYTDCTKIVPNDKTAQ